MIPNILIDDDDLPIAMSMSDMLDELSFASSDASSADKAMEVVGTDASIAMIFTDPHMPSASGYQRAHRLRLMRPKLPVVLVKGDESALGADHGLEVLSKPCTSRQVSEVLQGPGLRCPKGLINSAARSKTSDGSTACRPCTVPDTSPHVRTREICRRGDRNHGRSA